MSRFYGNVRGMAETEGTRRGNTKSGMYGHIRGWNVGADVQMAVSPFNECNDYTSAAMTSGSYGGDSSRIFEAYEGIDGNVIRLYLMHRSYPLYIDKHEWKEAVDEVVKTFPTNMKDQRTQAEFLLNRLNLYKIMICKDCNDVISHKAKHVAYDNERNPVCPECSKKAELKWIEENDRWDAYIIDRYDAGEINVPHSPMRYEITDWPGRVRFKTKDWIPNKHNWGLERIDVWFQDHKENWWWGVHIGYNHTMVRCRKLMRKPKHIS